MEEKNILLFEDYLENKLSKEELLEFEKKIKTDAVFAEDFSFYKSTHQHLKNTFSKERRKIKETLKNIDQEHFSNTKTLAKQPIKTFKLKSWHYGIAASILMLFGVYFFNLNKSFSYNDYAFSQTINLVERNDTSNMFRNAETTFNSKKYTDAIKYFNQILEQEPDNYEVFFYKGVALVEINNFTAANVVFDKLQKTQSIYKNKALFYLGLSKLKQKDFENCKKILVTLPKTAEDYNKAQEIIKKLKQHNLLP